MGIDELVDELEADERDLAQRNFLSTIIGLEEVAARIDPTEMDSLEAYQFGIELGSAQRLLYIYGYEKVDGVWIDPDDVDEDESDTVDA